jgi:hypothetical protein
LGVHADAHGNVCINFTTAVAWPEGQLHSLSRVHTLDILSIVMCGSSVGNVSPSGFYSLSMHHLFI